MVRDIFYIFFITTFLCLLFIYFTQTLFCGGIFSIFSTSSRFLFFNFSQDSPGMNPGGMNGIPIPGRSPGIPGNPM